MKEQPAREPLCHAHEIGPIVVEDTSSKRRWPLLMMMTLAMVGIAITLLCLALQHRGSGSDASSPEFETAADLEALSKLLNAKLVHNSTTINLIFFDLDETLVMPENFIYDYGLPRYDALCDDLEQSDDATCPDAQKQAIYSETERLYYSKRTVAVDGAAGVKLVHDMQGASTLVFPLTSRRLNDTHTPAMWDGLKRAGFCFSVLYDAVKGGAIRHMPGSGVWARSDPAIGSAFFVEGEDEDKAEAILRGIIPALRAEGRIRSGVMVNAFLVDNTAKKLRRARDTWAKEATRTSRSAPVGSFYPLHYTAIFQLEPSWKQLCTDFNTLRRRLGIDGCSGRC